MLQLGRAPIGLIERPWSRTLRAVYAGDADAGTLAREARAALRATSTVEYRAFLANLSL